MKYSKIFKDVFGKSEDFIVGEDDFSNLQINSTEIDKFYYFYHQKDKRLIKHFILLNKDRVDYICQVILIKKGEKFTPRLSFSVRDKTGKIAERARTTEETENSIKANVNLVECYEHFWKLVAFLQSLSGIEIPRGNFSLVSEDENAIIAALHGRSTESVLNIIKALSSASNIALTQKDINALLKRKEKLVVFEEQLKAKNPDESKWQEFFDKNKWIFGYGLNYEILRPEQSQPNYGGTRLDGKGGQKGDNLMSTSGDLSFTVLVEIKTPATPLLQGTGEIRNGAWSLSRDLTDAISQIQANIQMWEKEGSAQEDNKDRLEKEAIYTVKPKGIIVIGHLGDLVSDRHKWQTFQRFRKSIHGIDIITFDELYKRAKFIVDSE